MFYFHPDPWGKDSHFDEHIFQMGWFNHQLAPPNLQFFSAENRIPPGIPRKWKVPPKASLHARRKVAILEAPEISVFLGGQIK